MTTAKQHKTYLLMQNWAEDIIRHYCPSVTELDICIGTPHITGEYDIDTDGDTVMLSVKASADDYNRIRYIDQDLSFFKNHISGYDHEITTGDIPFLVHFTVDAN